MHFTKLEQITKPYHHIYLSPHLDDAALSCGGAIAAQGDAHEHVLVITLCTAIPKSGAALGPLAEEFHGDWNLPHDEAVTARLSEDLAAMGVMGCDSLWLGLLDSIYRMPFAYDTREKLFGRPLPDDPLYTSLREVLPKLRSMLPNARFYVPMGIGYHVDHQIVYDVAQECLGSKLLLYEDVYYVLLAGERERRMAELDKALKPEKIKIGATIDRKIAAIKCYASQVPELFGGFEAMERDIRGYATELAAQEGQYAEQVWTCQGMKDER